jgi:hypothetical protein
MEAASRTSVVGLQYQEALKRLSRILVRLHAFLSLGKQLEGLVQLSTYFLVHDTWNEYPQASEKREREKKRERWLEKIFAQSYLGVNRINIKNCTAITCHLILHMLPRVRPGRKTYIIK